MFLIDLYVTVYSTTTSRFSKLKSNVFVIGIHTPNPLNNPPVVYIVSVHSLIGPLCLSHPISSPGSHL